LIESGKTSPYALFDSPARGKVEITDSFWSPRRELIRRVSLPSQWDQLETFKTLDNFRVAAGVKDGTYYGAFFCDSDLYKWLEAASYIIGKNPDAGDLSARVAETVYLIAASRMEDGYLNTHYRIFAPERRWTNLLHNHELYCAGHLIEAACAHHEATGHNSLLDVAIKFADLIAARFGPEKNRGVPGHEEIELAMIRLYRVTGEKRYLDTASFFIHRRGRDKRFTRTMLSAIRDNIEFSRIKKKKRAPYPPREKKPAFSSVGWADMKLSSLPRAIAEFFSAKYFQQHKPLMDQTVAVGHSVRAMYFYTGAADLYLENGDGKLLEVLELIWNNTANKRTYITGGIGSLTISEGFGKDYELPNKSYTETCAAIASFFYSWRMLRATGEAKYADLMERTLYNAILSGLSQEGKHYFYQNPLVSYGATRRKQWYVAACCPPNLARFFASLESYIYGENAGNIRVHQYIGGKARFQMPEGEVALNVDSGLPFEGTVKIRLSLEAPMRFALHLRQPEWTPRFDVEINGDDHKHEPAPGTYLDITREWKDGDVVEISLQMRPRPVASPPEVRQNRGKVAIMYGPLLYCVEDVDNKGLDVHKLVLDKESELTAENKPNLLGGITVIEGRTADGKNFTAIPYYAWANRGLSHMEVWIKVN